MDGCELGRGRQRVEGCWQMAVHRLVLYELISHLQFNINIEGLYKELIKQVTERKISRREVMLKSLHSVELQWGSVEIGRQGKCACE